MTDYCNCGKVACVQIMSTGEHLCSSCEAARERIKKKAPAGVF